MLKVPSNTAEEPNLEFCVYKRTLLRGRVPVKLVGTPTGFVHKDYGAEVTDSDILFLVCTNSVDVVQFKYLSHEWVTLDTFFVPFQTQNAATLSVPSWKNSFALLVSCEENNLLVLEYSCKTQVLNPHRLLKFQLPVKDLLGTHLCVDPYGYFVFFGSLGETHFCIYRDFLVQAEETFQLGSLLFPSCETISQNIFGVNTVILTNKLIQHVMFCVEDEMQTDVRTQVLAILLVDCVKRRQYIYFYNFDTYEHSVVFKCEVPLHHFTRETVSLRSELMLWNRLSLLQREKKLAVFGENNVLLISLDASWFQQLLDTTYDEVEDKQLFRENFKANCEIIRTKLPQDGIQQTRCIAFASSCSCIARQGIRYFAFFDDGSLIGLKLGSLEAQATSILVAEEIPNKDIVLAYNRSGCEEDGLHGVYFYAVSSTRGLLSFHLKRDGEEQGNVSFRCEKLSEIPFHSPVLYVSKNSMKQDNNRNISPLFTSTFGMDAYSGIWELYKHIPLQSLSHHEEKWEEECIKILCLPCNAGDFYDSLVVISFLHSTRVLQYDANENCFLENNQIFFETMQSTVYCSCFEGENYLQVHKGGIRLSLVKDESSVSQLNREIVDWNPLPQLEILQATSEKNMVAIQWSQQHYQIYLLQIFASSQTIEVVHVLSLSCQISYFCLQWTMEDPRICIGTYEGTLELYSLTTGDLLFRFSLDNLILELPKSLSSQVNLPNMITTRVESLICRDERIYVGTRDGYLWILTLHQSNLQICYGKSLGTAPLQLFLWSKDDKHTSMLLGVSGNLLWWVSERNERFYFRMLYWDHIFDGELPSGACISCPFHGWSEYPTLFLSISKKLALLQVPLSDRPSDIWYSKIYHTSQMTLKVQKYFITSADGFFRETDVNILVVRKATRTSFHSSYEVQAWTLDMKAMLAHLVLPSHTAVTSICVWKQFLLIGATEESVLYSDIRVPNTKGRVVLLQLVRTKHDEVSCRFMVNCEFLLPGAVMVVTPLDEETLLVSCNEHLLAFAMDPQEQTLIEIARGETRGLILVIDVEHPFIFVGDRKDSVHIYCIHTSNREIVPVCQDEYRKLVVSLATQPFHDHGQLVFVGDRQAMLHVLWCPFSKAWNTASEWDDSLSSSHNVSLMTCLCSIPWNEIPIHLSFLTTNHQWDTGLAVSSILACSYQLMVTSMDGTWSQLVFIRNGYAKLLWKLQRVIDQFFRWPVESNTILDGDRLVWFLSSKYSSLLSDWGNFTEGETLQLRHLLYFLEDLVRS